MICRRLTLFLLVLIFLGAVAWIGVSKELPVIVRKPLSPGTLKRGDGRSIHPLVFFDKDAFYSGVEEVRGENRYFKHQILGGVIPHHLFPSFIIADFFSRLSKQDPQTIVLMGPNHYERGSYKVLSSLYNWETPFGVVEPHEQIIRALEGRKLLRIDEVNFPKEYSVAGLMPFIKYFIPTAKVVPLILSGFMDKKDIELLSNSLRDYVSRDTVIVVAVDFSHHLNNQEAYAKDRVTLELMKTFSYDGLLSLGNDYLDSSPCIVTLLMTMQLLGSTRTELLYHSNSGEMQRNDHIETTSYFSIVFY